MRSLALALFALSTLGLYAQEETASSTNEQTTQEVSVSEQETSATESHN